MKNNVLFILAEGDHDIAFIYRILKVNGFKTHNKKIKEYIKIIHVLPNQQI